MIIDGVESKQRTMGSNQNLKTRRFVISNRMCVGCTEEFDGQSGKDGRLGTVIVLSANLNLDS